MVEMKQNAFGQRKSIGAIATVQLAIGVKLKLIPGSIFLVVQINTPA